MKKKVYEKQLSQLRPDLTSKTKGETKAKSKSKKSRVSRQESPKESTSGKSKPCSEYVGVDTNSRAYPQPKVGTLPKVDVLIKRRNVEPEQSVSKPDPLPPISTLDKSTFLSNNVKNVSESTEISCTDKVATSTSAFSENSVPSSVFVTTSDFVNEQTTIERHQSTPESRVLPSSNSSYRIDLNENIEGADCIAAGEQTTHLSDVSINMSSSVSVFVTSKPGELTTSTGEESHMYQPALSGSIPVSSNISVCQAYVVPDATQPASVISITSATTRSSQPVSLVSSPQHIATSGQYTTVDRAQFLTNSSEYSMPQYQAMTNNVSNELHTLTPMVLPDTRRFDDTTPTPGVINYGDVHPVSTGASWEQENNRYTEYPTSWRSHSNESIYLNNGISHALKMPFVNGNRNNLSSSEIDNNNDSGIASQSSRSKLYPRVHQENEISTDDKTESDAYVNGYTSDDSSSAKISVGGSTRRRRKRVQTPVQRSAANMRERRRMCHLNDAFNYLKEHLPNVKDKKKLSRIQTLKAAIYYIHLLRDSLELQ